MPDGPAPASSFFLSIFSLYRIIPKKIAHTVYYFYCRVSEVFKQKNVYGNKLSDIIVLSAENTMLSADNTLFSADNSVLSVKKQHGII
jgi:hypothetical protein